MTSIETMPGVSPKARAAYKLKVVSFNVQQLLAAQAREGKNQTEMASYLGIKPSGMSLKADQMLMDINTEKATGNTPMASSELLRLGLNQRPSD